jgi:hypothetical protein
MFSLQQNWRRRGQNSFCLDAWGLSMWGMGGGGTIYTHVSKCKNNKIKEERKKFLS